MKNFNSRVYAIVGIEAINAKFNADMSGLPRTSADGRLVASDKALKKACRNYMQELGHTVFTTKRNTLGEGKDKGKLIPCDQVGCYVATFGEKPDKDHKKIIENLFSTADTRQFGITFAVAGCNFGFPGAVQIRQGYNIYDEAQIESHVCTSPYRNPNGTSVTNEDGSVDSIAKSATTLGKVTYCNEAHYIYNVSLNPNAYNELRDLGLDVAYTDEDYALMKDMLCKAVTNQQTVSKAGCDNELAIFIETDMTTILPDLGCLVRFEKAEDGKKTFHLGFANLLKEKHFGSHVKSIEVHYNPYTTNQPKIASTNAKYFNIITGEEI